MESDGIVAQETPPGAGRKQMIGRACLLAAAILLVAAIGATAGAMAAQGAGNARAWVVVALAGGVGCALLGGGLAAGALFLDKSWMSLVLLLLHCVLFLALSATPGA